LAKKIHGSQAFRWGWPKSVQAGELRHSGRKADVRLRRWSLFEDLDLHGLAAEQAFEFPNPLLQPADLGCGDNILI
jgi:DNA-nicking Smr family endonuclease